MRVRNFATRALALFLMLGTLVTGLNLPAVYAADHRDSNSVDALPEGDITDVYSFVDPNNPANVVMAMGVNPFLNPNEAPSVRFAEDYLYQFKVDNGGSLLEDVVVQIRFLSTAGGPQSYEVRIGTPSAGFYGPSPNRELDTPVVCAGRVDHANAVNQTNGIGTATANGGGTQCFVGVRDDAFVTDVAQAAFRIGLNPNPTANARNHTQDVFRGFVSTMLGPLRGRPLRADLSSGVDGFGGFDLGGIAVSIPKALLRGEGILDDSAATAAGRQRNNSLIGVWGTVSRPKSESFDDEGVLTHSEEYVQFERMGQQLANTVWIFQQKPANTGPDSTLSTPQLKDRYNTTGPETDAVNLAPYVPDSLTTTPTNESDGNTIAGRKLLLTAGGFLTPGTGTAYMLSSTSRENNIDRTLMRRLISPDYMRLNIDLTDSVARPGAAAASNNDPIFGILSYGVQNGRRPYDDVTDIYLRMARELTDVKFPAALVLPGVIGLVPGSGPQVDRKTLSCGNLNVASLPGSPAIVNNCEDGRIFAVLQGTDWIKKNPLDMDNLTNQGHDINGTSVFPYLARPHPVPGEAGTTGFPEQQ